MEQIQNVAVIVNDRPFPRRLAHWLLSCPNLKRIIGVIEPRFPRIEKRPTTGNIVAFASRFTASTCEGSSSAEVVEELRRCLEGKFEQGKLPWIAPPGVPRPRHLGREEGMKFKPCYMQVKGKSTFIECPAGLLKQSGKATREMGGY